MRTIEKKARDLVYRWMKVQGVWAVFEAQTSSGLHWEIAFEPGYSVSRQLPREALGWPVVCTHEEPPVGHNLDAKDTIWRQDHVAHHRFSHRDSAITAVAKKGRTLFVLGSGHGMLPLGRQTKRIMPSYSHLGKSSVQLIHIDDDDGHPFQAKLLFGKLGGTLDFGVAAIVGSFRPGDYDTYHLATSSYAPHRVGTLDRGYGVFHVPRSQSRPGRPQSVVSHRRAAALKLDLPDRTQAMYTGVWEVTPKYAQIPFSTKGESGGLVVNDDSEAVGTIVGGNRTTSFVLPLDNLIAELSARNLQFFFKEAQ